MNEIIEYKRVPGRLINLEVVNVPEDNGCNGCAFYVFNGTLSGYTCPSGSCKGKIYKVTRAKKTMINISDIKSALCTPDICMYYEADMSCRELADVCLIRLILRE